MSVEEHEQRLRQSQRAYTDFLDDKDQAGVYAGLVEDMIKNNEKRIIINLNDLRRSRPERAKALLDSAGDEIVAFQRALKDYVGMVDASYAKTCKEFYVGFEGSFGARHVTARTLTSSHLNNLVCIEGIATRVSLVRPKVVTSVHYCPATAKTLERNYTDMTSLDAYPSSAAYPTQDEDGNPLQTEYGLSTYRDHQTLTIQELPEKAPTGQLPRSVDVILENDLVDACKPGDRVQIVAAFRCLPGKQGGYTSGSFKTVLLANNLIHRDQDDGPTISGDDVQKCKALSKKRRNIFDLLAKSLAPSIHGHDYVKKALLCMLLGGVEKILPNGSRLRGDINILLIGDPSVAKSQMLRYVLATSIRSVATTGRGSSGVGLTAAVTTDQETGERRLEAGAMVLADRGIVCIDEFDKMTDMDRTAIHEVMEQGRVTISKAGIHARLNARCSVLAAANPVYGRYDPYKSPMENIGLQDSLLSRFDLLFILLDSVDEESDRKISDHVLRVHRYRDPREADGTATSIFSGADDLTTFRHDNEENSGKEASMWDNNEALFQNNRRSERLLSIHFVKKYIEVAKCLKPVLTEEACELIGDEYSKLRSHDFENADLARTQPVTARALETLIRLSTAHAKARLSKSIDREDAETAIELVQFAYFKKVLERERKRRHDSDDDAEADSGTEEMDEEEEENVVRPTPQKKEPKRRKPEVETPSQLEPVTLTKEEKDQFRQVLFSLFEEKHVQEIELSEATREICGKTSLRENQILSCIEEMSNENKIMMAAGIIYLI